MSSISENIILRSTNLSIGYVQKSETKIIGENINFEISRGELTAVIGINGAGKSTLLRTISAIQPHLKGQVSINDTKLTSFSNADLAREISLVLTEQPVSKNLEVFELIALGRQPYTNWIGRLDKKDIKQVFKAMALVDIEDLKNRKCYELSDGQFQKVLIARALAQDTSMIILDEPTTHLDLFHKAFVLKLLQKLSKKTNKAIVFASHEINLALQLCDKILVLKNNSSVFGSPEELIKNGSLTDLFPEKLIEFDAASKSFRII